MLGNTSICTSFGQTNANPGVPFGVLANNSLSITSKPSRNACMQKKATATVHLLK